VATIITFTPLQPPVRTPVRGRGRLLPHRCQDVSGHRHQQRLPLGSVRGIMYLDALCLHCGAHFVWVEDDAAPLAAEVADPASR
jgi:hypothetical protein